MNKNYLFTACVSIIVLIISSCGSSKAEYAAGAGGYDAGMGVNLRDRSYINYDLVPVGDRITYTIDISTPEGKQKLKGITLQEAKRLAETEASRKYNCDRLIDPRFDYLKKEDRILRITVDGRPANYKTRD